MIRLIFPGESYDVLRGAMLSYVDETCTLLLAQPTAEKAIVVERFPAPDGAYSDRGPLAASLRPEFLVPIVQQARDRNLSVIFAHTHPAPSRRPPAFSPIDDAGEIQLAEFLGHRIPGLPHFALVVGSGGCAARRLGTRDPVEVLQIGKQVRRLTEGRDGNSSVAEWDRQVRAFGNEGQARIRRVRTAIVGCGGTGSVVAQQLAHLGVQEIMLIDPDVLEVSNLNRVVGTQASDVGRAKVHILAESITSIGLGTRVTAVRGDIRDAATARQLTEVDAIISCTDSHSSRAAINQLAYQYVIPAFDVGVAIGAVDGEVTYIAGRAQMLAPGLACLVCGNTIDAAQVRRELQSDAERARDPYIVGHGEPQPAVISINSTMSSLLVTMFLGAFAGVPARARHQLYDGLQGRVRSAMQAPTPGCIVCSASGALAKADSWPLPTRTVP